MSSIASLRSLPPKQALALLLAEKSRRMKVMAARQTALEIAYGDAQSSRPPEPVGATSLVLDKAHVYSDLYYSHAPYIVLWGGRGAAKTWAVAEALIRKAAATQLLIGCAREFQNSIKDSSHRILKNTIERLGLQSWFIVTVESIKSKSGSEFIFKGLHNAESLRSLEGCDILWVDEAQSVSEYSWRSVIPTIRKDSAQIIVTFNLMDEADSTYQRFVIHPPTGAIVHKVNFDSNPYFGGKLKQDMEDDRRRDFHLYEHIWLGMPLKINDAVILNRKYIVEEFDDALWHHAPRLLFGLDFGFSNDPLALVRMFVLDRDDWFRCDGKRRLFISHEVYGTHIENNEMAEALDSVPGVREWPIKADSARPETISMLRGQGFSVTAAEKWDGCVKDGITHLRGYDEIVIHERCKNTALEARLWRYKVDPKRVDENGQPEVLPIVVDKHNHAWDGARYGLDGYITRGGELGIWERLSNN